MLLYQHKWVLGDTYLFHTELTSFQGLAKAHLAKEDAPVVYQCGWLSETLTCWNALRQVGMEASRDIVSNSRRRKRRKILQLHDAVWKFTSLVFHVSLWFCICLVSCLISRLRFCFTSCLCMLFCLGPISPLCVSFPVSVDFQSVFLLAFR